jgi:hypothetical protein
MRHPALDARVLLPVVLAAGWFATAALPRAVAPAGPRPSVLALPPVRGAAGPTGEQSYELDAERSVVRFLVLGSRGELWTACRGVAGSLHFAAGGRSGEIELRLDLGTLAPLPPAAPWDRDAEPAAAAPAPPTLADGADATLLHLLGVHRGTEIVYRASLVATTEGDLPLVTLRTFVGQLRFASRVLQQPMQLWQSSLPGQPLRLQGHGTVPTAAYGLPQRHRFGLYAEQHTVTLGLDLVWRRRRAR